MNQFKIGDRVRAVKDCSDKHPKKGWKGKVTKPDYTYCPTIEVLFDNGQRWWAFPDEIELIESEVTRTPNVYASASQVFVRANGLPGPGNGTHIITGTIPSDEPKPFPTFEEFDEWFYLRWDSEMKTLYNYFAQFKYEKTVEVPLELGNMYEFSSDKENWERRMLHGYSAIMGGETKYYPCIRPIQPSRLEQLKAKHPNLSNDELIELLEILLTQMRE